MQHTELATIIVLISAVLHASWNAVVRGGRSRFYSLALVDSTALIGCLFSVPFVPFPPSRLWLFMLLSVALNTGYRLFLIKAYERGDFGKVYPIIRGTPPILVSACSFLVFGEALSAAAYVGIGLISLGIFSLVGRDIASRERISPALMATMAGAFIAAYTVVDARGVRLGGNPIQYIVYLTILQSLPIPILAAWKDKSGVIAYARRNWVAGVLGGAGYVVSYGLILLAFTLDAVAKVAALRETSVLVAAAIATLFFREQFGVRRAMSATVILAGILAVKISR